MPQRSAISFVQVEKAVCVQRDGTAAVYTAQHHAAPLHTALHYCHSGVR